MRPTSTRCSSRRPTTSARARTRIPTGCVFEALRKTGRAGIGRFTFHDREYLVAVRALDDVLALHTLRFHDEVVDADELEIPRVRKKPSKREVQMARKLVDTLARGLRPHRVRGHLSRGGARADQAQGEGRGDRPRRAGGARAGRRPDGGARGERLGRSLMARPLWSGSLSLRAGQRPRAAVQRRPRPGLPFPPAARQGQTADRAAALLLEGGRRGRLGGGRELL